MVLIYSLGIIFAILAIGFFCGKKNIFTELQFEGFELFLFKIAIPCYLFTAILSNDLSSLINADYIYSYLLSFAVIATITTLYFWRTSPASSICIKILASGYVNAAIYALPVITFLLDDPDSAILGNLVQVIIIQSVFLTMLSFICHSNKSIIHRLFVVFKNPLVSLPILGIILKYNNLNLPFISAVTKDLGNGAAGMALFTFGLNLSNVKIKKHDLSKDLMFVVLTKNMLHPIAAFLIGKYIFALEDYWLYSLVIATSAPTAFIVYLIAKQFSTDTALVKKIIAITSVLSLVFLALIIVAFNMYNSV